MTQQNDPLRKCDYVFDVIDAPCVRPLGHEDAHITEAALRLVEQVELGEEVPVVRNDYERRLARLVRNATLDEIEKRLDAAEIEVKEPGQPGFDASMGIEGALDAIGSIIKDMRNG